MKKKIYIICNSHLDPVWIWNRSSGRSSWLNTMHSVIRVMHDFPELKFTCSSSALYRWIEDTDPALFREIALLIEQQRWEIVGGWEVQSDVIISRAEPLIRQALSGKDYFRRKFGVEVTTAYNVDSFGHCAALPKILRETGFTHYVFLRSQDLPPLFNWKADDGSEVTALKILLSYGTGGANKTWFEEFLQAHVNSLLEHQAMFFGIGDHGGGISRTQLGWLLEAQEKYEIVFSTLGEYFQTVKDTRLPEITGELGPVFRGCYSNCHEIKHKIARAARRMLTAEKLGVPAAELQDSWRELLFHHFHDILPGTSIREAFERDIFPGLGSVESTADRLIDRELHRRSSGMDTMFMKQGGLLCWNPHPFKHRSILSHIGFADPNMTGKIFNVLCDENGNEYPLQLLPAGSTFGPCGCAWGRLTSVIDLPPLGFRTFAYGSTEKSFQNLGFDMQKKLLKKLSFEVFFDDTHTWGFGLEKFTSKLGCAENVSVAEYLNGPVCSILRSVWKYGSSEITLDLIRYSGIAETGVKIRLDWHEIKCALKLVWHHELSSPSFVCGSAASAVNRLNGCDNAHLYEWRSGKMSSRFPESGEVSMVDWCAALTPEKCCAFYAPDLHSCDHAENALRITLARPVLYSDHAPFTPDPYYGWMDQGVSWRDLWIGELDNVNEEDLPALAQTRLINGESCEITAHEAASETFPVHNLPEGLELGQAIMGACRLNESGKWEIHLHNPRNEEIKVKLPQLEISLAPHAMKIIILENTKLQKNCF